MTTTLIHDTTILMLDAQDRVIDNGHVLIRDGDIAAVGAGRRDGSERIDHRIDGAGRLLAPASSMRIAIRSRAPWRGSPTA